MYLALHVVNWTPISKWYMARLVGFENGHQKDTLHDEIELYVQYTNTILSSIIYTSERACVISYRRCRTSSVILLLFDHSQSCGEHLYSGIAMEKTPIISVKDQLHGGGKTK